VAIPEQQRAEITTLLNRYCAPSPRSDIRRVLQYGFTVGLHDVVLFEQWRPSSARNWVRSDVARFRWYQSRREWNLFCMHSDLKWHRYEYRPWAKRFTTLLAEVDRDPTGIFWG
jgi:Protein of unknown function (DUF3024)